MLNGHPQTKSTQKWKEGCPQSFVSMRFIHYWLMQVCMHLTCSAMLSLMTMLPIWSSSCASEVMVVVAVAMFSTLRLHMRRSSSQSASPVLPHGATRKPGGGVDDCTPSNSLTGRRRRCRKVIFCLQEQQLNCRSPLTEAVQGRLPWLWPCWCWCPQGTQPLVHRNH